MPEVRFEDVVRVELRDGRAREMVDPILFALCERNSLDVCGAVPDRPAILGARIEGGFLVVETVPLPGGAAPAAQTVICRLSGVRAGFGGRRFVRSTLRQMLHNNKFWARAAGP